MVRLATVVVVLLSCPLARAQCEGWLQAGGTSAVDGASHSFVWDPDGPGPFAADLYIGGNFDAVGNQPIKDIARWDGVAWRPLGTGVSIGAPTFQSSVGGFADYQGGLIVSGNFTNAGGVAVSHLARWNGSSWQAFGPPMSAAYIHSLATLGGDLYAGASLPAGRGVARWSGTAWEMVGAPFEGTSLASLSALALFNGQPVVGGRFSTAGGVAVNNIARWDGFAWQPLGAGVNVGSTYFVRSMVEFNGELIIAGGLTSAGPGIPGTVGIARWSGSLWKSLGTGIGGDNPVVHDLVVHNGKLIAGGEFMLAGGIPARKIAQWDGTAWQPMSTGLYSNSTFSYVWGLSVHDGEVVATGTFHDAGGILVDRIAVWDGSAWHPHGKRFDAPPMAFQEYQGGLVVGGQFMVAGGKQVGHIAHWNGDEWNALGTGTNGFVMAATVHQGDLVIGGSFDTAGGISAKRVARWDGSAWNAMGNGLSAGNPPYPEVQAFESFDGELIAAGVILEPGAGTSDYVAAWDGSVWHTLGLGLQGSQFGYAAALTVHDQSLIAGGQFDGAGGAPANNIARWDGAAWHPLGAGISGQVRSVAGYNADLIAAGSFTSAGGATVNSIARWNGTAWLPMGTGLNGIAHAVRSFDGHVVVAGLFSSAAGVPASNIARWNGSAWLPMGSGLTGTYLYTGTSQGAHALSLGVYRDELHVGGYFLNAGGQVSTVWGRWSASGVPWIAVQPEPLEIAAGGSAAFTVLAAPGYQVSGFQWRRNGVAISNGPAGASPNGGTVSGATTPDLAIDGVQPSDAGDYDCVVSTPCGSVISNPAALTVAVNCYPDCNGAGGLTIADFGCFQTKFVAGDPYADCNGVGGLTIADFGCFQTKFVAGCP